jgi:hypothetical protein
MKNPFAILSLILLLVCSCTDIDDNLQVASLGDVIKKDSEMYNLLDRTTKDVGDPLEDIVCIDFVYPLQVKLYDENLISIGSVVMFGDDDFSNFLGSLAPDQYLSISYPITTELSNGDAFTINNNTELKIAIDNCSREDIVTYCNSVFCSGATGTVVSCVWKVDYVPGLNNNYVGGTFMINPDSSLVFNYKNVDYYGNWIFLFVNDVLHININLEGTSQVATDWNIDRQIILAGNTIQIVADGGNVMLTQSCETTTEYLVGDTGPAGGIVFYDKGSYSEGWRYIEVAPQDLGAFEWGCSGSLIDETSAAIGTGLYNSARIANFHDNLVDYYGNPAICNAANNGTVVAQNALLLNFGGTDDWFLPSEEELGLMYTNLHSQGLGNFTGVKYWSSTEADAANAECTDFTSGSNMQHAKIPGSELVQARAIRYF